MSTPKGNAVLVEALGSALRRGGNALADAPDLLRRVLEEESWREFVTPRGELVQHARFVDFVTTAPTRGIGASVDLVRRIIADDTEAIDLLERELQAEHGGDRRSSDFKNNNVHLESGETNPQGNSRSRALRRLHKAAPELHADVLAGRLSAHAAMVQAGFRPKTVSVPVARPDVIAAALRKHMTPQQLAELRALLE